MNTLENALENEDKLIPKETVTRMRLDKNVRKVQELLDQKVPIRAIAREMECSVKTIRDLIKFKDLKTGELKPGAPRTSVAHLPENVQKIIILRKSGYGVRAISRIIGCSPDILYVVMKENNICGYTSSNNEDTRVKDVNTKSISE